MRRSLATLLSLLLALIATPALAADGPIVLAAASMQESLNAAADAWAKAGHQRPVLSFAASSALAREVEAGAPADLFISADPEWMDAVAAKQLVVAGTRATLVGNRLVIVAPAGSRGAVPLRPATALARVLGAGPLAMADPNAVPAGLYGKAALTRLGAWEQVRGHVVAGDSVRAALALVERGVARYGIVYATDARASAKVRVAAVFPAGSHPPILYPVARLARSTNAEAESFRRFLLSRAGRAILLGYGFTAPGR